MEEVVATVYINSRPNTSIYYKVDVQNPRLALRAGQQRWLHTMRRCCVSKARPEPRLAVPTQLNSTTLRQQLSELRLKELRARAKEVGVDEDALEDATDSDDPRQAVVELLLRRHRSVPAAQGAFEEEEEAGEDPLQQALAVGSPLRDELSSLKLKALKIRARELGVSDDALDDADDADDVRAAVTELCLEAMMPREASRPEVAALRAELSTLKLKALKKRARVAGVSEELIDDADDADDVKSAVIQLIVEVTASSAHAHEAARQALESELAELKIKALKKRAKSCGVSQATLDDADDAENIRAEVTALIISAELDSGSPSSTGKPQFGDSSSAVSSAPPTKPAELVGLTLKELRLCAKTAGMSADELDGAMDADDAEQALIEFLVARHVADAELQAGEASLLSELQALGLKALRKRAKDAGATAEQLLEAMDADEPRDAAIELIVAMREESTSGSQASTAAVRAQQRLRAELQGMLLRDLRKRAKEVGVSGNMLDNAMDDDDPEAAVIELIVAQSEPVAGEKPHFGQGLPQAEPPIESSGTDHTSITRSTKHVMLSYQWDHQAEVTRVYGMLTKLGITCWMDVQSGMGADIYDGMADAVSNACVVVCFMSEKYQQSENCMLELKFAKQSGVGMIPVMMEGGGWRPSGWLGLITAGSLWVRLSDGSQFEDNVRQLHGQIQGMVGAAAEIEEASDDEGVATASEAKEELERLREDLVVKTDSQSAVAAVLADPSQPATIPAGVPKLPARFQSTEQIAELTRLVLSTSASDMRMPRVGFWGMGGIGKTVTGAAIVRDESVRLHFHAIIWIPLGQTPVIAKLQNLCHMQCTGKELSSDMSSDEKQEALQQAMKGKRVMLCLDDLWEAEHELDLNFVDASAGSKVLISSRAQALLDGGHQVEVGLPSPSDSARMLLAAAGTDSAGRQPHGVREVVGLCGRLPLALGIAGRLAASLGLVGTDDWSGMIGVLKEELHQTHSGGGEVGGMIRASLRGLKGSAQEQASVKALLLLFALVPEDTHCPLEVLLVMFNAVHTDSVATLMHIRKWLRILITRSLVLGTIDRPSVHDLVLDFAVAQHSGDGICCAHRAVVDAFRAARPVDVHRRRKYDPTRVNDPVSMYVCHEVGHHVKNSIGKGDELTVIKWLEDVPQDVIVLSAFCQIGYDRLSELAAGAEVSKNWWLAARYWLGVQTTMASTISAEVGPTVKGLEAMDKLGTISPDEKDKEDFQLELVAKLATSWDMTGDLAKRPKLVQHVLSTEAALRAPVLVGTIWIAAKCLPQMIAPNVEETGRLALDTTLFFLGAAESDKDESTRTKCLIMAYNFTQMAAAMWLHLRTSAQWDKVYGVGGGTIVAAFDKYDYDLHHELLCQSLAGDWFIGWAAPSLPLLVHYGDVKLGIENMGKAVESIRRIVDDDDHMVEQSLLCCALIVWPTLVWSCRLSADRREVMASIMHDASMTFSSAEATVVPLSKRIGWMRELGDKSMDTFHTAEYIVTGLKCSHILMADLSVLNVSEEEIMQDLPSVEDIIADTPTKPGQNVNAMFHTSHVLTNSFLSCAYVCEKLGRAEEALQYALAGQTTDFARAGTTLPLSRVLLQSVQARSLAALGRQHEAGPVFEAAAEECHEYGLHLYEALALRDLKVLVLDPMGLGEHGARHCGAVLRGMVASADDVSPLLGGLDAAEMMAMGEPDPSYTVQYQSDPEPVDGELREELGALRLMALHRRAGAEGVDAAELDAAMETASPKAALIDLLVAASSSKDQERDAALRRELAEMKLMTLHQRALGDGIAEEKVEVAMESDSPKVGLAELIMQEAWASRRVHDGSD
eukprot:COSAG06_NODE_900_length_11658_cov_9.850852_4_plen_1819_part_00